MPRTPATLLLGLMVLARLQFSVSAYVPNQQATAICESGETLGDSENCCQGDFAPGYAAGENGGCTFIRKPCFFGLPFLLNWRCPRCYIAHATCWGSAKPAIIYYDKLLGGWYVKPGKVCEGLPGGEAVFTFIKQGCIHDPCPSYICTFRSEVGEAAPEPAKRAEERSEPKGKQEEKTEL